MTPTPDEGARRPGLSGLSERLGVLEGVRVAEVGTALAGRLLVKLLADQGATVDAGDFSGAPDQAATLAGVDVVIDSLPASAPARALLEAALAEAPAPGPIVVRLSTFPAGVGQPDYEPLEWVAAAELGFYRPRGGEPALEDLPLASAYAALQGALYVAAALLVRQQAAVPIEIGVALTGAGMVALSGRLCRLEDPALRAGESVPRIPIAERYRCADGRYLQCEGTVPAVAAALCTALGHPEWAEEAVAGLTRLAGTAEVEAWRARLSEKFAEAPAIEWEQRLAEAGAAGTACRTRAEWCEEAHAFSTGILAPPEPGASGRVRVGPTVRLFEAEPGGASPQRPASPVEQGATAGGGPLSGVKVVDLCIILAGPTCGRLLAELGAEVTKVEAPFWTRRPYIRNYGWLDVNRSKSSTVVDLRTEEGRDVLWRLIEDADVLVENYRLDKIARLGFSFEEVARRNPRIVYVSLNAYDFGGPMSDRPGWDPNAQAVSGMQVARATGGVPRQVPAPVNDYATGIAGAFGAVLALGAARRSGSAKRVLGSLSRTASFLETPHLSWSPDPDAPGASVFLEAPVAFHPCADGFIVAEEPDKAVAGSAGVLGADELRALTCEAAVEALRGGGRRAAVARTPDELHGSAWVEAAGLLRTWAHPRYGPVSNVFGHAAVNGFSLSHGWPTHDPGEDNAAVLARVGYAEKEIDELVAHGAVLERVPLFPSASD